MVKSSALRSSPSAAVDALDELHPSVPNIVSEPKRHPNDAAGFDKDSIDNSEPVVNALTQTSELLSGEIDGADATDDHTGRLSFKDALPLLVALAAASWVLIVAIVWATAAS